MLRGSCHIQKRYYMSEVDAALMSRVNMLEEGVTWIRKIYYMSEVCAT